MDERIKQNLDELKSGSKPVISHMGQKRLHMIGNAHIDPVWLWQWQEGFHEIRATFYSALQLMKEYDDFIFISSSAAYYEWIELIDPEMFAEIRQRVAEGRWGIVGGWWVQPDCNIPAGESFVRQGLYGQHYFKQKFGVIARVGYNVDSFGHNGMLPQILKKSGMDAYIFMRPSPHEKGLPGRLFWWESDDRSRVLAYRIPYEYATWGKDLETHVARCAAEAKSPFTEMMCFYGVGNHGGGPTRENLDSIHRMMQDFKLSSLEFNTPERFFEDLLSKDLPFPVVHDDLQYHASGCYAAHSGVKRWNRQSENLLLVAEKYASLAKQVTELAYPAADLKRAWKGVLFNQFHDILAGTSIESAYEDARNLYGEAQAIGGRALNAAVQSLAWKINIPYRSDTRPLVIFNPHSWSTKVNVEMEMGTFKEDMVLTDHRDRSVPFQEVQSAATAKGRTRLSFLADLPPMGYSVYHLVPRPGEAREEGIQASDTLLESERWRLEFDPDTGWIKSLFDKRHACEVFMGPAARPVVLEDGSDTWSHNVFRYDQAAGDFKAMRINLLEHGPVKSIVRVVSEYGASRLVQDFTMYRDLDQIDVKVTVDWRERFKTLKLRFPLNMVHMRPVFEIPYGAIERVASGEEEPGQSWLDVSGMNRDTGMGYGFSLLNDGKYSFDVNIRDVGLTVLRSPIYAHHLPVVPEDDTEYSYIDQGIQHFTYSLLPHTGSWEDAGTVRKAAELNQSPVALAMTFHPGPMPQQASFLSVDSEHIVVTVLKQAEDNEDLILRCVETAKMAGEAKICLEAWDREIQATFGPSEIKTFRVPVDASLPVVETNLLEWEDSQL